MTNSHYKALAESAARKPIPALTIDIEGNNLAEALAAVGAFEREFGSWVLQHENRLVPRARSNGMSWAEIGTLLGRSRQAVWEKYAGGEPE